MREKEAFIGIDRCQHSSVSKVTDQIGSQDTESEFGTKAMLMHPFKPLVCIADDNETIRIWDYDADDVVNTFENHNNADKSISKLCLLNELDDSLLLVASIAATREEAGEVEERSSEKQRNNSNNWRGCRASRCRSPNGHVDLSLFITSH